MSKHIKFVIQAIKKDYPAKAPERENMADVIVIAWTRKPIITFRYETIVEYSNYAFNQRPDNNQR